MIAQVVDQREQVAQAIVAEFEGVWQEAVEAKEGEEAERLVLAWTRAVGRRVLEAALQAGIERREEQPVSCCGKPMIRRVREWRQVVTVLGPVRVRRRYLLCQRCQAHGRPVDKWLRWSGGFSPVVEELVAWECSLLPYREALRSLEKLAGVEVSVLGAERIVGRWSKQRLKLAPYAERVDKDLVIEIDGSKAHLEEGWKEIKVGACFSWDRADPNAAPEAVTYCGDWERAEQFRETLWREALVRGVSTARSLAVIGDGAPWIWEMASHLFPRGVQVLDWYHLTEHLGRAAKVLHGEKTPETTALVERWKTQMQAGCLEGVEEELRELVAAGGDDKDNTLRKCADYLQTNQARLRYHLFRAAGWPIGSGVVEGACKHVVGVRMKRNGMRWSPAGAQATLSLRTVWLNGEWDTFWAQCPLAHAA